MHFDDEDFMMVKLAIVLNVLAIIRVLFWGW